MRLRLWLAILIMAVLSVADAYTAEQYIRDVLSGRQIAGRLVQLAMKRHVDDLARVGSPDFPYRFDAKQAMRVIDFKQQLQHTKGEWANPRKHDTRIRLEPWQQAADWILFGWRRLDGYRRFTKAYVEVARKNGKTTDAAATANYCLFADSPKEMGPQIICVGPKKDQAKIAWEEAKMQIDKHPILRRLARTYKQNSTVVLHNDPAAKMTIWGKDADAQDGFNPSFALVDEAHLYPGNEAMEVIESGLGARQQPLVYIITTAGLDVSSPCYQEERTFAVEALERTIDPVPEHFFALIYTLDDGDDWTDESVWIKANPNIGVSVRWEWLRQRVQDALSVPSRQNQVKTKNFNLWTQAETRWISDEAWTACKEPVDEDALIGRPAAAAYDLSSNTDLTAVAIAFFPTDTDRFYRIIWRFFIPGDDLIERERRDKVPYSYWLDKGHIIATPGQTIDHDLVEQEILALAAKYAITEIAYDPWQAAGVSAHLEQAGFTLIPTYQRYSSMASPTKDFERLVLDGDLAHGGNPVMRWMIASTEVKSDRQGNIMPMKPKRGAAGKRIDGVVAAIMALDRVIRHTQEDGSVYDERGVIGV